MWELYDALIEGIPSHIKVDYVVVGPVRTLVYAGNLGMASTINCKRERELKIDRLEGKSLRDIASLVKSWNYVESGIGLAAINAHYNNIKNLGANSMVKANLDAFENFKPLVHGKKVAVIGHFESAVSLYSNICELSIIEREPKDGDYPDPASEFLLPEQDFVFVTGMTFSNKTLPRILQLSREARTILMGPSVPLAPVLFEYGVEALSGFCVTDSTGCLESVESGEAKKIYNYGKKLVYYKSDRASSSATTTSLG